jgi:hypothetical protein
MTAEWTRLEDLEVLRRDCDQWKARALAAEAEVIKAQRQGCALVEKARGEAYEAGYTDGYGKARVDFGETE